MKRHFSTRQYVFPTSGHGSFSPGRAFLSFKLHLHNVLRHLTRSLHNGGTLGLRQWCYWTGSINWSAGRRCHWSYRWSRCTFYSNRSSAGIGASRLFRTWGRARNRPRMSRCAVEKSANT